MMANRRKSGKCADDGLLPTPGTLLNRPVPLMQCVTDREIAEFTSPGPGQFFDGRAFTAQHFRHKAAIEQPVTNEWYLRNNILSSSCYPATGFNSLTGRFGRPGDSYDQWCNTGCTQNQGYPQSDIASNARPWVAHGDNNLSNLQTATKDAAIKKKKKMNDSIRKTTASDAASHTKTLRIKVESSVVFKPAEQSTIIYHIATKYDGVCKVIDVVNDKSLYVAGATVENVIENLKLFPYRIKIFENHDDPGQSVVLVYVKELRLCKDYSTKMNCRRPDCGHLHVCRDFVAGGCCASTCGYAHSLEEDRNMVIIKSCNLNLASFNAAQLETLVRLANLMICPNLMRSNGCTDASCIRLHVCVDYITHGCSVADRKSVV